MTGRSAEDAESRGLRKLRRAEVSFCASAVALTAALGLLRPRRPCAVRQEQDPLRRLRLADLPLASLRRATTTQEEADLLQKVVSYAESAYDQLSQEFNYQIEEPTPLIFYETHSDFEQNNIILNFIPEGIGAFASPVRNRMVLPVDLPDRSSWS